MGPRARVMPVIVLHGDRDQVVPYRCGEQALRQWLDTVAERERNGGTGGSSDRGDWRGRQRTQEHDCAVPRPAGMHCGAALDIHGMGHAWCGGSSDSSVALYTDPRGPSAAAASSSFFSNGSYPVGAACMPVNRVNRSEIVALASQATWPRQAAVSQRTNASSLASGCRSRRGYASFSPGHKRSRGAAAEAFPGMEHYTQVRRSFAAR